MSDERGPSSRTADQLRIRGALLEALSGLSLLEPDAEADACGPDAEGTRASRRRAPCFRRCFHRRCCVGAQRSRGAKQRSGGSRTKLSPSRSSKRRRSRWLSESLAFPRVTLRCTSWGSIKSCARWGFEQTQSFATLFDGITKHNPEGLWLRRSAQEHGFKAAVPCRDSGKPIPEGDEGRPLVAEMEAKKPRGA